ncbi:GNAT family N-acetyltransferase [soil metagenome]
MQIETERLTLMACGFEELDQFVSDRSGLATRLGVTIPNDFPVFPEGIDWWRTRMQNESVALGWAIWFVIRKEDRILIGDGGFKGPPNEVGEGEIGYALVENARGSGLGKELARALSDWAFKHPDVTAVLAETLVDGAASIGVLKSLGMTQVGTYDDPDEGTILQWRVDRAAYTARSKS